MLTVEGIYTMALGVFARWFFQLFYGFEIFKMKDEKHTAR